MTVTPLHSNVTDTALVFEGGGMRAAYSSGVVATLLDAGIYFDWAGGISAGSSCVCNYVSRDAWRAKASFVDMAADPRFGDWRSWARGRGFFNAEWIYEQASGPDDPLPFDADTFYANPARVRIGAVKAATGEMVYWGKDDLTPLSRLLKGVRASSTMPILMPMPEIDGELYVDGALGPSGGIAVDAARADGFERFFVVTTRPRGYRKAAPRFPRAFDQWFRKYPAVAQALTQRHLRYNESLAELEQLETEGRAYVFRPVAMTIQNSEKRLDRLGAAYEAGRIQAAGEIGRWREFLGL